MDKNVRRRWRESEWGGERKREKEGGRRREAGGREGGKLNIVEDDERK